MEVDLVPDQSKSVATTAKLTVPTTGPYHVRAEFADNQDCCAGREGDAWVLTDSEGVLFTQSPLPTSDGMLSHATGTQRAFVTFDEFIQRSAGDSIYFASGALGTGGDHAVLRATIDLVPEPSSIVLIASAALSLLGLRRRNRRAIPGRHEL